MRNTKKGFTLVELLVVIAILAILATVSVVGYTSFIDRANNSNAETELHQIQSYINADLMADNKWEFELEDGTKYVVVRNGNLLTATKNGVAIGVDVAINDCPDFDGLGDCTIDASGNLVYTGSNGKGTASWEGIANACEHEKTNPATCLSPETCKDCGVAVGNELADHVEGTAATCTTKAHCSVCDKDYGAEPVGHVYVDGVCSCGANMISKTYAELAALVGVTQRAGSLDGKLMSLDANISLQFDKGAASDAPALYDEIRLYQKGGIMTIKASYDATMSMIVVHCNDYVGNGNLTIAGGTATLEGAVLTIVVDAEATEVVITTGGTAKEDRLYITNVEVYYTVTPHVCADNAENVDAVPSTCTEFGATAGTKCTKCGAVVSGCEQTEKADHNYVGGHCSVCGEADPDYVPPVIPKATITFDDTSKRTVGTTSQQVWVENGITVTNDKAASTSNVNTSYYNPIRLYASSSLMVEKVGMTKIEFTCNTAAYATALETSIGTVAGVTVTVSEKVVTVTFAEATDSFTIAKMTSQIRMDSLTVTYTE